MIENHLKTTENRPARSLFPTGWFYPRFPAREPLIGVRAKGQSHFYQLVTTPLDLLRQLADLGAALLSDSERVRLPCCSRHSENGMVDGAYPGSPNKNRSRVQDS
jgi:hypothetical protein